MAQGSQLMATIRQAQFLANALNRPQAVLSYTEQGEVKYCIAEMVSKGWPNPLWYKPSNDPAVRYEAREKYNRENTIPE